MSCCIRKYYRYLLFLLVVVNIQAFGQSLEKKNIISKSVADSLYNLGSQQSDLGNTIQALDSFKESLSIYSSLKESQKIGDCYNRIDSLYKYQSNYSEAIEYYYKALETYKSINYKKGVAGIYNNLASVFYNLGNFPDAVTFLTKATKVVEETGDLELVAILKGNIGTIYSDIKDFQNALKYYEEAKKIYVELKDKKGIAKCEIDEGYVYIKIGKYAAAAGKLSEGLKIAERERDKESQIEALWDFGELFYTTNELEKSTNNYNKCLSLAKETQNFNYQANALIALGKIHNKKGSYKLSITKCQEGYKLATQQNETPIQKDGCECLYLSYKALNRNDLALASFENMKRLEDSLKSDEASDMILNMEFQKQQLVDSINYVKKEHTIALKHQEEVRKKENQRNGIIVTLVFIALVALLLFNRLNLVRKSKKELQVEKDRSDELLLNILPEDIAEELKTKGHVNTQEFNLVSILFTDFKSFTQTAEKMTAQDLVEEIDCCFKAFDHITEKYQIEKIKTIGDAYMAAGGIPTPREGFLKDMVLAGLEMQAFIQHRAAKNSAAEKPFFEMRIGIHAGHLIAGVVGVKKFQYDVWGDTVNIASRMESNGMPGKVNVSHTVYEHLKEEPGFSFEYRGEIEVKGKGELKMYFVEKAAHDATATNQHTKAELELI